MKHWLLREVAKRKELRIHSFEEVIISKKKIKAFTVQYGK